MRGGAERGTDRPPARYSELGSSWPTACSVTRAAREDGVEVQAGAHAGLLQHVDQLLGGDVAAGARGERAAAEAADRGVQLGHPGLDRGQRVGLAGAAGVVEVHADRDAGAGPADGVEQLDHAQRRRRPDRVAEAELVGAGGHGGPGDVDGAGDRGAAVERAVPGGGDDDLERAAGAVRQAGDLADGADRLGGRPAGVGAAVAVGRGHDVLQVGDAGVDGADGAPRRWRPAPTSARPRQRDSSAATWSASARAGTAFGETKDVASIRRTPVATSASSISSLASSGTGASSCRPSRMPTSRTSTAVGQHQVELVHACLLGAGVVTVGPARILHPAPVPPMRRPGTVP